MITAEIIDIEEEPENKNIVIWICFKHDDGKEVVWYYEGNILIRKGRNVWPLVGQLTNFMAKSEAEKAEWIDANIKYQFGNVISLRAKELKNAEEIASLKAAFIGRKLEQDKMNVSIDVNAQTKRVIELKDDGTFKAV